MPDANEKQFNQAYCARVRALRIAAGYSQKLMAAELGVHKDSYRQMEGGTRDSPLPPYLIVRFCLLTGVSVRYLLTGEGLPRQK